MGGSPAVDIVKHFIYFPLSVMMRSLVLICVFLILNYLENLQLFIGQFDLSDLLGFILAYFVCVELPYFLFLNSYYFWQHWVFVVACMISLENSRLLFS